MGNLFLYIPLLFSILNYSTGLHQKKFSERQNNSGNIWAVLVAGSNGWWNYRHQINKIFNYEIKNFVLS
uniref:Uncharacterized protein n=1 Tax=Meloidogyne enterolobii TaxID=390850 RepID=A0A6V7WYD6_MELEN|nr:unnamed protein product [Meloidogyne enterolobii]